MFRYIAFAAIACGFFFQQEASAQSVSSIREFRVVKFPTQSLIAAVKPRAIVTIDRAKYALNSISVEAIPTSANKTQSIVFDFHRTKRFSVENIGRYFMTHESDSRFYKPLPLKLGTQTIKARVYAMPEGKGKRGKLASLRIKVIDSSLRSPNKPTPPKKPTKPAGSQNAPTPPPAPPAAVTVKPGLLFREVDVGIKRRYTENKFKIQRTRVLSDASVLGPPPSRDSYGGNASRQLPAKGHFYTAKVDGRWMLVTPQGHTYFNAAMAASKLDGLANTEAALEQKYGTREAFFNAMSIWLRSMGFNGIGAWSNDRRLRLSPAPHPYSPVINCMKFHGDKKSLTATGNGHALYKHDILPVWDEDFAQSCAEAIAAYIVEMPDAVGDSYLLGVFSDNELPFLSVKRASYLKHLSPNDPNYQAAQQYKNESAFRTAVLRRYLEVTSQAIRSSRLGINPLVFGPRLMAGDIQDWVLTEVAAQVDVIAMNNYDWDLKPALAKIEKVDAPVLLTEYYAKGPAPGLTNKAGWGFTVESQEQRGYYYQHVNLQLLSSKVAVGAQWLKLIDNNPMNTRADPSNLDSNKGFLNLQLEAYLPLASAAQQLNTNVYQLLEYYHGSK